jgi:cation-transporting ATPase 13A1
MEKATLEGADWSFSANEVASSHKGDKRVLKVLMRFHFTSVLSRMATIVMMEHDQEKGTILGLVKGAPEVLMKRIKNVPNYYSETFLHYASQGKRVIAMAYKKLPVNKDNARHLSREEVESDLTFCGFLIFECPLKEDSQEVIDELTQSSHKVIMITGDNPLTACEVAKELHICSKPLLILEKNSEQKFYMDRSRKSRQLLKANIQTKENIRSHR